MKVKDNILGIAELLLGGILAVGSFTVFAACGEHEGKYMACHWAQNAVVLIGTVIVITALIKLFAKNSGVKAAFAVTHFLLAVGTAFIPGKIINLCMMETMRCQTVFKPAVLVISLILAVVSGIEAVIAVKNSGRSSDVPKKAAAY